MSSAQGPGWVVARPGTGRRVLVTATSFGLVLLLWELSVRSFDIDAWVLPAPSAVFTEFGSEAPSLARQGWTTVWLALTGFATGVSAGLLAASLLHNAETLKPAVYPWLVVSQNIPSIALAPLLIIWFGYGVWPKLILIILWSFFPVAVSAMDGFYNADRTMRNYMRMSGASRLQTFRLLEFSAALPAIFSGIKLAAANSVICAVFVEWIGSDRGIGYYMLLQKNAYRVDRMFLSIAVVIALSLALYGLTAFVEHRVIRWRTKRVE